MNSILTQNRIYEKIYTWNNTITKLLQKFSQDYVTPSIIFDEKVYQDSTFRYLESEDLLFSVSGQLRILQIQKKDLEFVE